MKITGANILDLNGNVVVSNVTITSIDVNGSQVNITYVDGSGNLKVVRSYVTSAALATGCSVF